MTDQHTATGLTEPTPTPRPADAAVTTTEPAQTARPADPATATTQPAAAPEPPRTAPPMPGTPPHATEATVPTEAATAATAAEGDDGGDGGGGARRDRRARPLVRGILRWTAAVAVFAAVGASTAYGITRMERTDVPGLRTESDGRWAYPELTRPPLPSGSPAPFDAANTTNAHHADLRALVLPAPEGATEDKALRGSDGWLPTEDFLEEFGSEDRERIGETLADAGLRHIAARGWTTPDGAGTRVYLLRFDSVSVTEEMLSNAFTNYTTPVYPPRGGELYERDDSFPDVSLNEHLLLSPYVEAKPYGAEQVRLAYVGAGDVMAVIVQSRKGTMPVVPFHQTVVLQGQLLA
ncbi:hypothetical protein [Streptomyces sp. NPDC059894]|uniref:hypothetical protein n=1 Tax=unclassified Streptomyces TaxID=2593676 RepID=UPI003661D4BC